MGGKERKVSEKLYFLTSRHGNCGSTVMFHNLDERGYGTDLSGLNKYTPEQAKKHHECYGRDSLPLLTDKVMNLSKLRVDHQYIEYSEGMPTNLNELVVVSIVGRYDGNDIQFVSQNGTYTFNFEDAEVCERRHVKKLGCSRLPWSWEYMNSKARPTLQQENINVRSMCRGVKLKRIVNRVDSGKTRWNCPSCGKIHWQYNPYDFEGCNDYMCDEYRY